MTGDLSMGGHDMSSAILAVLSTELRLAITPHGAFGHELLLYPSSTRHSFFVAELGEGDLEQPCRLHCPYLTSCRPLCIQPPVVSFTCPLPNARAIRADCTPVTSAPLESPLGASQSIKPSAREALEHYKIKDSSKGRSRRRGLD